MCVCVCLCVGHSGRPGEGLQTLPQESGGDSARQGEVLVVVVLVVIITSF